MTGFLTADIINYIGHTLERHRGCDLLDINPGTGVWSRALHEAVQPRKHVFLDLDGDFYEPFLHDLLDKPNVEMVKKSGVIWKNLEDVVVEHFPQQTKIADLTAAAAEPPPRNDTLLVTANLSTCPKRTYRGFDNVGTMVLYQFLSSIRQGSLLQQYGRVRFLVWANDDEKHRLLPRSILRRRRAAFEAELSCEWLHEVAGDVADVHGRTALRDDWLSIESCAAAIGRMQAAGMVMPAGRESSTYQRVMADPDALLGRPLAGVRAPHIPRPYVDEYDGLRATVGDRKGGSEDATRLNQLYYRHRHELKLAERFGALLQQRDAAMALPPGSAALAAADAAYVAATEHLPKNKAAEYQRIVDNYHLFRQTPHPALLWDRRAYEPLVARGAEFFPNAPTTLLDMQPKAMDPLLRQYGPGTSRSGETSDVLLQVWYANTLAPLEDTLERLWGGFGNEAAKGCPSFWDPKRGGSPLVAGLAGRVPGRCANETQWLEIVQAWMDWPFRPTFQQLLSRWAEASHEDRDEDTKSGAQGLGF